MCIAPIPQIQLKNNMSILFVTHDLGVVSQVSNRIQVLYAGEIVEQGHTNSIISSPKHPYTQALLYSLPRETNLNKELYSIEGAVPPLSQRPDGCQFSPRCSKVKDECKLNPIPTFISNGINVKCLLESPGNE